MSFFTKQKFTLEIVGNHCSGIIYNSWLFINDINIRNSFLIIYIKYYTV